MAVFEEAVVPEALEDYLRECKNKTIFSLEQLKGFYEQKNYRTVVKMILLRNFENKIILDELIRKGMYDNNSGPRLFDPVPEAEIPFFENHE